MARNPSDTPSSWGKPIPPEVAAIPIDPRNTAPETRARYEYQDECVALALIPRLANDDLLGVAVERFTDFILVPREGYPEFVSVKHREPNHRSDASWTWSAIKKESILEDLHAAWKASGAKCKLAFVSNAGFSGPAKDLWLACTNHWKQDIEALRSRISRQLKCGEQEAERFLMSLTFPQAPWPRRNEITDIAIRKLEDFLQSQGRERAHASGIYERLLQMIREAGTDIPNARRLGISDEKATITRQVIEARQRQAFWSFLETASLRAHLLNYYDRLHAEALPNVGRYWESDPLFAGRRDELEYLDQLLIKSAPIPVPPVVINGMTGCGKTSLALQYAATRREFRPIFIDASVRSQLITALVSLGLAETALQNSPADSTSGSIAPNLPETSGLLLIIDGVNDPHIVQGLIPRESLCRVIITSTHPYLDDGFNHLPLSVWKRNESVLYLDRVLQHEIALNSDQLASALHDHPLAIAQAANYCRLMSLSISDYMARLEKAPVSLLSRGEASGYKKSIIQAVRLSIEAARSLEADSFAILAILAHLGPTPIPSELFLYESLWVFVGEYPDWKDREGTHKRPPPEDEAFNARIRLQDDIALDSALEALIKLSLIRKDRGSIGAHPLVQLIVRNLIPEKEHLSWLSVTLGVLFAPINLNENDDDALRDVCVPHLESALKIALSRNVYGAGVIGAASTVSQHLIDIHDYESALSYLIPYLNELTTRVQEGRLPLSAIFGLRIYATVALTRLDRVEEAQEMLAANVNHALESGSDWTIIECWLVMARIAIWSGDRDLAVEALERLSDSDDLVGEDNYIHRLSLAHNKTQLYWLLNRLEDAVRENQYALSLLERAPDVPQDILEAVHGDAATLARGRSDIDSLIQHEMFNISAHADPPASLAKRLKWIERMLTLADAQIDAHQISEAESTISRVESVLDDAIKSHEIMGHFYAIRGRLGLDCFMSGDPSRLAVAHSDLLEAAGILRAARGPTKWYLSSALVHLAQTSIFQGLRAEAIVAAEEAVALDMARYGVDHPETQTDLEILHLCRLYPFGSS